MQHYVVASVLLLPTLHWHKSAKIRMSGNIGMICKLLKAELAAGRGDCRVLRAALIVLTGLVSGCVAYRPPETSADVDYHDRYQYPLISPGAQFAALPPAVQNSIRAETGGAELDHVFKGSTDNRLVYVIYFRDKDLFPPLYIAPDGTVLNPDLSVALNAPRNSVGTLTGGPVTGLTLSDLPPKVVKAIQQRAPDAEIDFISKQTLGDQTTYVIAFKDHARPALHLGQDGTVLKETAR